jgi:pSer/pThr/pTyr-binding forkhead associated (FHA) protein
VTVPDYVLEIVEGPEAGRRIPLSGPLEIGRDPTAGAPLLQDDLISRRHVRVTPEADGARIEDLDSRNGTFVDGDQIFAPAHLPVDGQLLVGVSVLQLRAGGSGNGTTAVRQIPESLTSLRPLPAAMDEPAATTIRQVPTLAKPEAEPDYVPPSALERGSPSGDTPLVSLLDSHTKSKARGAPIGIFVLVAFAVILYLALR